MKYHVEIAVMTNPKCRDPQAEVILNCLQQEFPGVKAGALVAGRYYSLDIERDNEGLARTHTLDIAGRVLANPVMEFVKILSITPIEAIVAS